jgi:hypothetical protein
MADKRNRTHTQATVFCWRRYNVRCVEMLNVFIYCTWLCYVCGQRSLTQQTEKGGCQSKMTKSNFFGLRSTILLFFHQLGIYTFQTARTADVWATEARTQNQKSKSPCLEIDYKHKPGTCTPVSWYSNTMTCKSAHLFHNILFIFLQWSLLTTLTLMNWTPRM